MTNLGFVIVQNGSGFHAKGSGKDEFIDVTKQVETLFDTLKKAKDRGEEYQGLTALYDLFIDLIKILGPSVTSELSQKANMQVTSIITNPQLAEHHAPDIQQ